MKRNSIHIGSLIRAELTLQNQTVTWLAEQIGVKRTNCYRILRAQSLHTAMLEQLSIVMQHDFFADCSRSIQLTSKQ